MSRSCTLYRHFDAADELLYVGIAFEPAARRRQHAADKLWWLEVARTSYEHHPTREAALQAEAAAIRAERPRWNVVHNVPTLRTARSLFTPRSGITGTSRTWRFQTLGGVERVTDLWLEWEVDGAAMSLEWDPEEVTAEEMLREFARRIYPNGGWAPILWMVMPEQEDAPFQISRARHLRIANPDTTREFDREHHLGMLTSYTWPVDAETGERLNFMSLPVPDRGWSDPDVPTWSSGFIQEATGWKPGALQPYVNIDMLLGRQPADYLRVIPGGVA